MFQSIMWADESGKRWYVPLTAPRRIVALASMKPGAKIVNGYPADGQSWHPNLEG